MLDIIAVDAKFGHLFTRFADMVKVYSPGGRSGFLSAVLTAVLSLALSVSPLLPDGCFAQAQPPGTAKSAAGRDQGAARAADAQTKGEKKDEQVAAEPLLDPSKTMKMAPVEIFQDPNAEAVMNLRRFNPLRYPVAPREVIGQVREMMSSPTAPVDQTTIRRYVLGMIAELTDTRNIQALIDPPPNLPPTSPSMQAISTATTNLLEPLFAARSSKSIGFLNEYNSALLENLPQLLKHHLVPRVQAMIVLGQSGNPNAYKLFVQEIQNPKQTVWVKLWAMRGITNIVRFNSTARLTAVQTSEAAKVIAAYLDSHKELPWPVQIRALEALAALRQGFMPTSPKTAEMASTAMRILADPKARPDVRAEAVHALGMMQITNAVPSYNFSLIAYAAAQLAAEIGDQIVANYAVIKGAKEEKVEAINATKAEYLASLLVGPIYQAFEGQPGVRDSGFLHNPATTAIAARSQVQDILDQIKPVSLASLELVRSPTGQLKARRQDLVTRVAVLKEFLSKNAPSDHHLIPDDQGYLQAGGQAAAAPEAGNVVAGASGGK
ncbi:MAG: hypothetical protein ACP5XB_18310 [Isosphaeraceae bacterium]